LSLLPHAGDLLLKFSIDWNVLLFLTGVTLGTGVLFGLFPALQSTKPNLQAALKGQTGQPSGARSAARFRIGLATAQIALAMALPAFRISIPMRGLTKSARDIFVRWACRFYREGNSPIPTRSARRKWRSSMSNSRRNFISTVMPWAVE